MKHIFIINPVAGVVSSYKKIMSEINDLRNKYDISTYTTKRTLDATRYIKEYLQQNPDQDVRFYACGGDGTINEVANGIVGYDNASMSVYPCGSGDDFVKILGGRDKFLNIENLINAKSKQIDLLKVNDKYSINVINIGFEANVCNSANNLKGKSKNPYVKGILQNLKGGMKNHILVEADGEVLNPEDGMLMLCTFANGGFVGGKFNCAPRAIIDDGYLETCFVKCTPLLKFALLIGVYQNGKHLEHKGFKKIMKYRRNKHIRLTSSNDLPYFVCIDGEIIKGTEFNIDIIEKAINFAIPE